PGIEPSVPGHAAFDHLAESRRDLACLLRANKPRQRLLDQLVRPETEQGKYGVVGLEDLALKVGHEHRVGSIFDKAFGITLSFVQLAHVAENADGADDAGV